MRRYIISTDRLKYLCALLRAPSEDVPVNVGNCFLLNKYKELLEMLTSSDINSMLGLSYEEYDILCDVVQLRVGKNGPVYPGSCPELPSVDQQRREKHALREFEEEALEKLCNEDPNHPACQECSECEEGIELGEEEFNELIQGE